ncbi:MAG TPA: glycosyltransferase family 39 protein [Candidatus Limnocylindrales bacterium]|nr:glycosyltransferase family 39 protein [Candidatus Limnocylindrales bacterium]
MQLAPSLNARRWVATLEEFVRNELLLVGILIALGTVVPVILGAASGALDIPRNDDWSYRRTALDLWQTGRLEFDGVAAPILIGQVLLVQPFLWLTHGSSTGFAFAGAIVSLAATLGVYAMARNLLTPARSFLVTLSLLLFPGYLAYGTSFMTDGPALAAQAGAIAIGMSAFVVSPTNLRRLALAMAIAVIGFSIRQFALAAVVALALAAIAREPRRMGTWGVALAGIASCALIDVARSAIPLPPVVLTPDIWFATRIPQAAVTISLMALPAAVIGIITNRREFRRRDASFGAILGVGLAIPIAAHWIRFRDFPEALLGNLATQQGVLNALDVRADRPYLFTDSFWSAVNVLGVIALVVVGAAISAGVGARRRRAGGSARNLREVGTPVGLVTTFVVVTTVGLAAYGSLWIVFDRYLWPLVPALAALLAMPLSGTSSTEPTQEFGWGRVLRPPTVVPLAILTLQGILALTLMVNAMAFDVARWRSGEALTAAGLAEDTIDAGYEWVGAHATTPADLWHAVPENPSNRWWALSLTCGVVTGSGEPPSQARLVGVESYRLYLFAGPIVVLYLYRSDDPSCAGVSG